MFFLRAVLAEEERKLMSSIRDTFMLVAVTWIRRKMECFHRLRSGRDRKNERFYRLQLQP